MMLTEVSSIFFLVKRFFEGRFFLLKTKVQGQRVSYTAQVVKPTEALLFVIFFV